MSLQSSTEIIGDGAGLAVNPRGTIDFEMRAGAAINQVLMNWNGLPTIAPIPIRGLCRPGRGAGAGKRPGRHRRLYCRR